MPYDEYQEDDQSVSFTRLFEATIKLGGSKSAPAGKFMDWWLDSTSENPLNDNQRIFHNCLFELSRNQDKVVLKNIVSLRKGSGSRAMKEFLAAADSFGVDVELYALKYSDRGLTTSQLVDWYSRLGFESRGGSENGWGDVGYDMLRRATSPGDISESGFPHLFGLLEDTAPFKKRLEWVVNSERDPLTAFLTLDVVLPPHSYAVDMSERGLKVLQDIRYITNDKYDHDDATTNHMTDAQALEHLRGMLKDWVSSEKWYDSSSIPDRSPWEKLVGWVANWVRKRDQKEVSILIRHGGEIADWFSTARPNIMGLKPSQAAYRSHRWHASMVRAGKEKEEVAGTQHLKKVATLDDGVEILELSADNLKDEGSTMRHCIGKMPRYTQGIERGTHKAFSVRRNGKRLYTVFASSGGPTVPAIEQFKGKANKIPGQSGTDIDAAVAAKLWFKAQGYYVRCSDLHILALDESSLDDDSTCCGDHRDVVVNMPVVASDGTHGIVVASLVYGDRVVVRAGGRQWIGTQAEFWDEFQVHDS